MSEGESKIYAYVEFPVNQVLLLSNGWQGVGVAPGEPGCRLIPPIEYKVKIGDNVRFTTYADHYTMRINNGPEVPFYQPESATITQNDLKIKEWEIKNTNHGQGLVEYALIIALVALVVVAVLVLLGGQLTALFTNISGNL